MLLPALSMAREKAKQAVCMNNLKQIGLAYAMYGNDWNDYLPYPGYAPWATCLWVNGPPGWYGGPLGLFMKGWSTGQPKYITTPSILYCPDSTNRQGFGSSDCSLAKFYADFEVPTNPGLSSNYAVNLDGGPWASIPPDGPYGSGLGVLTTSAMLGYACAGDAYVAASGIAYGNHMGQTNFLSSNLQILGFNILYFDGSVRWWQNNNNVLVNQGDVTNGEGNIRAGYTNTFWTAVKAK
jgi:prepilin-type processing-associated H-X9-DG protein